MKRAALYMRVSTEEQARHGLSLPEQRIALEAYAAKHELAVSGFYEDAGVSARKPYKKRPALLQLLEDCKAGKIDVILFIKLDRWFRNVGSYYAVQDILDQCGVSWQATQEDYETTTAAGRLKVNIMLSVAQDEADRTSERIKFVFEGKRARREPLTGNAPTGYRLDGKRLVKDEKTEAAVNAFFQKYLASGSISEAQACAQEEYQFRIEYQLASKMLDSSAYYGFYYGVEDMCPPYISKEEFEQIQSMRRRTVRKSPKNRVYLFSGLIVCGECGCRMGGRTNTRSSIPFYNCPGHYIKRSGCENKVNLSEKKIEAHIMDTVDSKLSQYRIAFDEIQKEQKEKSYQAEIAALKNKLSRLKDLYLNELISLEEYKTDQQNMTARIMYLSEQEKPVKKPDFSKADALLGQGWREAYEQLDRASRRDFWRILIKEIRIYPDRRIEYDLQL